MFMKQNFFPDGSKDHLKARLKADTSMTSYPPPVSLQVVLLLLNIASYYKCMLHTVDIRGAFLNAEFTAADKPIYLKINLTEFFNIYWQHQRELLLLFDRLLYGLK